MRLEIPLTEVQQFFSDAYKIDIDLKNIEEDKIEAKFIDSVVFIIKEVKEDIVISHYEVDRLAHLVSKVAHFFLEKKLEKSPIEWDSKNEEVKIYLKMIPELNDFLKFLMITKIQFINDAIVLKMHIRGKTVNQIH